jgi:hypothetical protein
MKYLLPALAATLLIPVPQVGNASVIEIIWFAVGLVAWVFSLLSIPQVVTDYVVASHSPNADTKLGRARCLLARGHVRREVIRHMQAIIIVGVGVYAMVTPNPRASVTVAGLVLTAGLVGLASLVAFQSWLDRIQRKHAEEVLRDEE